MTQRLEPFGKAGKITYWISTIWLALGMLSSGIVQVLHLEAETEFIIELGYPVYFLTILGIWKILGVVAILMPKFPLLKEWAYAGFFFCMSGAVLSHLAMNDTFGEIFPALLLLFLTIVSWYFRPEEKKFVSLGQVAKA
jgi:hypothetical protein